MAIPKVQAIGLGSAAVEFDRVHLAATGVEIGGSWRSLGPAVRAHLADRVGAIIEVLEGVIAVLVGVGHAAVAQPNLPVFQGGLFLIPQPVAIHVQELVTIQAGRYAFCQSDRAHQILQVRVHVRGRTALGVHGARARAVRFDA